MDINAKLWLFEYQCYSVAQQWTFNLERYLYIYNANHRHALPRFHLSAHSLEILEKDRTCTFCLKAHIENENYSFISDCFIYNDLQSLFLSKIISVSPELGTLNKHELFITLMQADNIDIWHNTAKFIYQMTSYRNGCLPVMPKSNWALHMCYTFWHLV